MINLKEYYYLVENRKTKEKYVMRGNLKEPNMGGGRYLYAFADSGYAYGGYTPYGDIMNVSTGIKYDAQRYRIVHQTEIKMGGLSKNIRFETIALKTV